MVPYVSAQVLLLAFGGHAVPVDESLAALLRDEQVVPPDATVEAIQSFLERQIKASKSLESHALLQAWSDAQPKSKRSAKSQSRPPRLGGETKDSGQEKDDEENSR